MQKHSMPEVKEGNVNVTPLIDIVMCLIIFFMLVAKIGVTTGAEEMPTLPETILGRDIKEMGSTLTLNIHSMGSTTDSRITTLVPNLETGNPELKEIALLNPVTKKLDLQDLLKDMAHKIPEFNVIIRAEGDLQYQALETVLITCAQAGVKTLSFNTKHVTVEAPLN